MTDDSGRLTAGEIARRCGVSVAAVSNWKSRHGDFPAATAGPGGDTFDAGQVLAWLRDRPIAANGLRPGERRGMTYADRFRGSARSSQARPEALPPNDLRSLLEGPSGARRPLDLVIGLVTLRIQAPETFARLRSLDPVDLADQLAGIFDQAFSDMVHPTSWDAVDPLGMVHLVGRLATMSLPGPNDHRARGRLALRLIDADAAARGRTGDHTTPACLVDVMVRVSGAGSATRVHDPFARAGELLVGAAVDDACGTPNLSADAVTDSAYRSTRSALLLAGVDADMRLTRMLSDHRSATYDVVLSNPPFGLTGMEFSDHDRRWRYGPPPQHNGNFAWLQHILGLLGKDGRAAVLMANNAATTQNPTELHIRAAMIEAGVVDAVVALPDRLFPSTPIAPSLWLLRYPPSGPAPDVLLMDATTLGRVRQGRRHLSEQDVSTIVDACRGRHGDSASRDPVAGLTVAVPAEHLARSRAGLNPRAHISSAVPHDGAERFVRFDRARSDHAALLTSTSQIGDASDARVTSFVHARSELEPASVTPTTIAEVCDLRTGPGQFDEVRDAPETSVVLPRSIRNNRINEAGAVVPVDPAQVERYRLAEGDVVCVRVGQLGRHGLVRPHQDGWLLGPGCLRIRPTPAVDPRYLLYHLGSASALDWLDRHATGSAVRGVSAGVLGDMPINLAPIEEQRQVGALLDALDDEAEILERAAASTAELRSAAAEILMFGISTPTTGTS